MADKPVLNDIVGGARLNPTAINANNTLVEDAIGGCLGRGGTGEADNSMTGNLDMDENRIQNVGDAVAAGDAVSKAFVESNYGSASTAEAEHWANYPEDSLVPEGDLVDDYSALHFANKASAFASAASVSASAASDSEVAAALSESNAATSEANAAASEAVVEGAITDNNEAVAIKNYTFIATTYGNYSLNAVAHDPLSLKRVAVGEAPNVCISSVDGYTWTNRVSNAGALNDVTWSPTLGLFCAVGDSGYIITSPDGATWTARKSSGSNLNGICWSEDLSLFLAMGIGDFYTSTDGITWTPRTNTLSINVVKIAWSPTLSKFAAVGGGGAIATSSDGITWAETPVAYTLLDILWSTTQSKFIAYGASSGARVLYSSDASVWVEQLVSTYDTATCIVELDKKVVVFGKEMTTLGAPFKSGFVYSSTDVTEWVFNYAPVVTPSFILGADWNGHNLCIVGTSVSSNGSVLITDNIA